jgi:hypothetical protein
MILPAWRPFPTTSLNVSTDARPPLPLDAARLCLDCDILTDRLRCPICARAQTFPLALWLIPLEAAATRPWASDPADAPRKRERSPEIAWAARPAGEPRPSWLIVVRAGDWELYDYLQRRFEALPDVAVILDRRKEERRDARGGATPRDRRGGQRRRSLPRGERDWWQTAGFRIAARAPAFSLYEAPDPAWSAAPDTRD